jgi:tRNA nucleotidyltransferase (CCA-adding enzyme)
LNINECLQAILAAQDLKEDSAGLKELQSERAKVEKLIRNKFGSAPIIRYGGSKAKGTLIKEAYDLDIACYLPSDSAAGETLEDIYKNVRACLAEGFYVEEKTSALRLKAKDPKDYKRDFHIDVVPGRFTDESKADSFIYQKSAEKCRLKTNLDVHIEHIKESGVLDAIRLLKLWKARKALKIKQFVFELLIIDILEGMKSKSFADQLMHVLTKIKENSNPIGVEDPANPSGNDLSAVVKQAWSELSAAASSTLESIENSGWEEIFGAVSKSSSVTIAEKAYREPLLSLRQTSHGVIMHEESVA